MGIRGRNNFTLKKENRPAELFDQKLLLHSPQSVWDYASREGYVNENGGLNLREFTEEILQIRVVEKDLDDLSGALTKTSLGGWAILIHKNESKERKKFTLAHELGHFFLHKEPFVDEETQIFYRQEEHNNKEFAADRFAAELLMPEQEIDKAIREGCVDVSPLAAKFGISAKAMFFRLKELGYLEEG